jgi:outer membrane murein-binding lipoprotein Lpp
MSAFEKAYWNTSGDDISILMPISKVDAEKRIVSGWATTDVVDKQGDIVSIDASERAFDKFRGNVREQHTPLAVGKVISFKRDKYFDKETGEIHNGIFVDVYVSKGAQDTWHKVTERILTGFSIGGKINETEDVYAKGVDGPIRMIKDYDLYELSLVDNPANPASNVVSIQKFNDQALEIEKNYLENVYWCEPSEMIIISEKSDYNCPDCSRHMTNIGFVESSDVAKSDTVKNLIKSFSSRVSDAESDDIAIDNIAKSIADKNEKEGNNVATPRNKNAKASEEVLKSEDAVENIVEEVEKSEEAAVETVEDAVEEVSEDIEKAAEEAVEETSEGLEKSADEVAEEVTEEVAEDIEKSTTPEDSNVENLAKAVDEIKSSVAGAVDELAAAVKSIADKVAELSKSINGVSEEVTAVKGNVSEFGQRVDAIEADTAVRKSGDLGGIVQEEKTEKSMWGGRFLKSADLYR